MRRRVKSRGITEISIKLLPEKAKRDYTLRLVSYIIVMIFVIINLIIVYIPRNRYQNELNEIKRQKMEKELEYQSLLHKYNFMYDNIYHKNNNPIFIIMEHQLDFNQILLMFTETATYIDVHDNLGISDIINPINNQRLRPLGSVIDTVYFNEADISFTVVMTFRDLSDITYYESHLTRIKYVKNVSVANYTIVQDNDNNKFYKATIKINLIVDPNDESYIYLPKVGSYDE